MKVLFILAILIFLLTLGLRMAWSQTVELGDGRRFAADVIADEDWGYRFRVNGREVQMPRHQVARITDAQLPQTDLGVGEIRAYDAPLNAPIVMRGFVDSQPNARDPQFNPNLPSEPVPLAVNYDATRTDTELRARLPLPKHDVDAARLQDAIEALPSSDRNGEALDALANAGDEGLGTLVVYGLYNVRPSVRTAAVQSLSRLGGQRVLKHLIEAFHGAARPTVPPYNVDYVQALGTEIGRLTGVRFDLGSIRESARAPQMAQAAVAWWNEHYDRLPAQLGEPAIDATDPKYVEKLREVRTLQLATVDLPGDILPPGTTNRDEPPRTEQQEFLNTFPLLPRDRALYRPGLDDR